jgi:hypothetical protein
MVPTELRQISIQLPGKRQAQPIRESLDQGPLLTD